MPQEIQDVYGNDEMPVKQEKLSSQISKLILNEILFGELAPGDKLPSESKLATKFGVSRTILREAIASLKNDGILESKPGRGLLVKNPKSRQAFRFSDVFKNISLNEITYFYEMRAILESEAAGLAAIRRTDEEIEQIRQTLDGLGKAVENNTLGAEEHDRYNSAIAQASHNPVLIEFLSFLQCKLNDLAKELRIRTMASTQRAHIVLAEHTKIVEMIEKRDMEGSIEAVRTHLKNAAGRAGFKILENK